MSELFEKVNMYHTINDITLKGEVVIFGSTFMADFPFYELSQKYVFSTALYNRSIRGLSLAQAEQALKDCVLDIKPSKIFFALGEHDLEEPQAIDIYQRIIERTKKDLPRTSIYLLSVPGAAAESFNLQLEQLAEALGIKWLAVSYDLLQGHPQYSKIFKKLTVFFRSSPLDLMDAFALAN